MPLFTTSPRVAYVAKRPPRPCQLSPQTRPPSEDRRPGASREPAGHAPDRGRHAQPTRQHPGLSCCTSGGCGSHVIVAVESILKKTREERSRLTDRPDAELASSSFPPSRPRPIDVRSSFRARHTAKAVSRTSESASLSSFLYLRAGRGEQLTWSTARGLRGQSRRRPHQESHAHGIL